MEYHPSSPPTETVIGPVTWTDGRYRECLSDWPYGKGPLSAEEYCDALDWVNKSPSWRVSTVPMGDRTVPVQFPWLGIPQVVPKAEPTKEDLLHESTVGQVPASTKKVVPMKSWQDWVAAGRSLPSDWNKYPTPEAYPTVAPATILPTTQNTGGSMDLGQILGGGLEKALDALIRKELGPRPANFLPLGAPAAAGAGTVAGVAADNVIDFFSGTKKRRHRRKRLATVSDIKDLAALKAVLGNGEAFKTWIATHSR